MKNLTIQEITIICSAQIICGDKQTECMNFSKDTREIQANDVYIGIKGENFDGNQFYEQAFEKGAKVAILQDVEISEETKKKYQDKVILKVKNTIQALQQIATYKREQYNIPVIAITGSSGKTSTKDMVANVVAQKYHTLKTQGNYNNQIGLPLTILKLKEHEALVVELGMNQLKEIEVLSKIAKPNIAIITNVGTSHIGNLGSRENILKAKLEILEGLQENGTLVINNDNDLLHQWKQTNTKIKVKTFGIDNLSDCMAKNIQLEEEGSVYQLVQENKTTQVNVPVGGKHFIYNSLCAIMVGKLLDIDIVDILRGIQNFELTKRRMDIKKNSKQVTIINDSYNANYDSVKAAIEYLKEVKANRKIAVLGDMLELGEFSKELHEKVAEEIIKQKIDILLTVGKEAQCIVKKAVELGMKPENTHILETTKQAIEMLKQILQPLDAVLIKASNGMKFEEIVEGINQ